MAQHAGLRPVPAALVVGGALIACGLVSRRYSPDPTHPQIRRWYKALAKPPETPPDAVFGGVWPVLLTGLGYGAFRLLRRPPSPARTAALLLGATSLGLVTWYSKITFGDRNISAGAVESAALAGVSTAFVGAAAGADRTAALAGVPLTLWSVFGSWLTARLARRNPGLDAGR